MINPQCEGAERRIEHSSKYLEVSRPFWTPIAENYLVLEAHASHFARPGVEAREPGWCPTSPGAGVVMVSHHGDGCRDVQAWSDG